MQIKQLNMISSSQTLLLSKSPQNIFPLEMIEVKGRTFKMGGKWRKEKPIHTATVPTFWIGKFPVTQSLYKWVMGENPSHFQGENRPVESVSWNDAQTFIRDLNQISGKQFRLPNETEWEYAARGGIHWRKGYEYAGSNDIERVAWYDENNHEETKPVGLKEPNQLGIYDMSGNVVEWCEDDWHWSYSDAPTDGSAWIDYPNRNSNRVIRGGIWFVLAFNADFCRVAYRSNYAPSNSYRYIGFRLVLSQF